ncbi:hypothetical protein J6590_039314 [Homalodisca vitripennis]|nr:hypothetical protein J6590_039314 [Homalodisca vitripennis]
MGHSVRVFTVLFVPLWTCRYNAVMADAAGRSPSNETNLPDIDKSDRWMGHSVRVFTVLFVPLWTCRYNAVMADAAGRSPSNETNLPVIDKSDR